MRLKKWEPWRSLDQLKSAYMQPEGNAAQDSDPKVRQAEGVPGPDNPPGELWGYEIEADDE